MKEFCDLHAHSTESDGTFTPSEIIGEAKRIGLAYVALTDHDTIAGIEEALCTADKLGVNLITGIELTIDVANLNIDLEDDSSIHILGYLNHKNIFKMSRYEKRLLTIRNERNAKMFEKAKKIGLPISEEYFKSKSPNSIITRGHFLRALLENGFAKERKEAFAKYLMPGGSLYVEKEKLSPEEVLSLISENGGVAVLAHPLLSSLTDPNLETLVVSLKARGLKGLEAVYVENQRGNEQKVKELAARHDLIITGGSDFHGDTKPGIFLGTGYGDLRVPKVLAERVLELMT